jgi:two-component system, NtrC family, sensor kinase
VIDVAAELRYDPNEDDSAPGRSTADGLRALVGAVTSAGGARSGVDVYESICRYLAEHGIITLVLVQRGGPGRYAAAAHRLSVDPFPKLVTLPRLEDCAERPVVYPPAGHPLCAHVEAEGALTFPSLSVGFRPLGGGSPVVVSFFAPDLGPEHAAAGQAFAAHVVTLLARLDAERRLREASARLEVRVRERTRELGALNDLSTALTGVSQPAEAVRIAAEAAASLFTPDLVAGLICVDRHHETVLFGRGAMTPALSELLHERLDQSLEALGGGHQDCTSGAAPAIYTGHEAGPLALDGTPEGVVEAPVMVDDRVVGLLVLANLGPARYSASEVRLLYAVAGQLASATRRLMGSRAADRQRLVALLEGLSDGVLLLTADGRELAGNQRGRELVDELRAASPAREGDCDLAGLLAEPPDGRAPRTTELTLDGEPPRTFTATSVPVSGDVAEAALVLTIRETTDDTVMRERLIQSEKMASLGQLVSGVAHELNNPLTGILGFAQLLVARPLDGEARRDVEAITGEAERASKIVQNLLSFARRRRSQKTEVDINELIERVLGLQAHELSAHDIALQLNLESGLPPCVADPNEMQQVLLNLVTNARQAIAAAAPRGVISVGTSLARGKLRIRITDDGPGIAPEHVRRVFDPFFTTKPVGEGTGLGLTISYGIVEEHRGHINVESRPGKGTTFTIDLPVAQRRTAQTASTRTARRPTRPSRRILVVDTEPAIEELLAGALSLDGHTVHGAGSAAEALALLDREPFDAVIADLQMPGMDGAEFYRRLQAAHPHLARRIIVTSVEAASEDTDGFIEANSIPMLPKPFDLQDVRECVAAVVSRPERSTPAPSE